MTPHRQISEEVGRLSDGPWRAKFYASQTGAIEWRVFAGGLGKDPFMRIEIICSDEADAKRCALKVAAAPDLLEALWPLCRHEESSVISHGDSSVISDMVFGDFGDDEPISLTVTLGDIRSARAALSRAEGREAGDD